MARLMAARAELTAPCALTRLVCAVMELRLRVNDVQKQAEAGAVAPLRDADALRRVSDFGGGGRDALFRRPQD